MCNATASILSPANVLEEKNSIEVDGEFNALFRDKVAAGPFD